MDDVIYRQDAIDALTTECSWTIYDEHGQLTPNGKEILRTLKKIPSVDAVEVVRCKDCKYFELNHWDGPIITAHEICSKWGSGCKTDKDGYCFLGERKTDG